MFSCFWAQWVVFKAFGRTMSNTHAVIHSLLTQEAKVEWGKWGRRKKEWREADHIISSKREKRLHKNLRNHIDSCSNMFFFYRTFSSAYLFQDGFSHWGLVSKTAQKELERLDGEVGVEGEVSHNVRGKALGNTYKKRTRGVRRLLQRQNGYVRVPRVYLL